VNAHGHGESEIGGGARPWLVAANRGVRLWVGGSVARRRERSQAAVAAGVIGEEKIRL